MNLLNILQDMQQQLNRSDHLGRIGRLFFATVLIKVDDRAFYLVFEKGQLTDILADPSRKIPWQFALKLNKTALEKFWTPRPEAGFHDIFGLVKMGHCQIEGDILILIKNLRYFKEFMALARKSVKNMDPIS